VVVSIYKNHPYEIVTTMAPAEHSYPCYGVKNVVTGVIEAYIGQLAKAVATADLYAKELKEGITTLEDAFTALLNQQKITDTGGAVN
jgi:hypothetical protein